MAIKPLDTSTHVNLGATPGIKTVADSSDLKRLKKDVINLFTHGGTNVDRHGEYFLVVHTDPKSVAMVLHGAGWLYDADYHEWSHDESYVVVVTGGGSATKLEFVFND